MLNTMGLMDTIENRDSIRERAIELIVEEKIKLIESKKENIEITDKEVDVFISEIFGFPSDEKKQFYYLWHVERGNDKNCKSCWFTSGVSMPTDQGNSI